MNTAPPWSRRLCTQPKRTTSSPTSLAVSWPQEWVRFSSRMNSATYGASDVFPGSVLVLLAVTPGARVSTKDSRCPAAAASGRAVLCCRLAIALQIACGMGRFFLSGQTTCALLLGAGLLLRAQAALKPADAVAASGTPRTRPSEMMAERAPRLPRAPDTTVRSVGTRTEHRTSHKRKGFAHRDGRHAVRRCGVSLAGRSDRCG